MRRISLIKWFLIVCILSGVVAANFEVSSADSETKNAVAWVERSYSPNQKMDLYLWDEGITRKLGSDFFAFDINKKGWVAWASQKEDTPVIYIYLWNGKETQKIATIRLTKEEVRRWWWGEGEFPLIINDQGWIVWPYEQGIISLWNGKSVVRIKVPEKDRVHFEQFHFNNKGHIVWVQDNSDRRAHSLILWNGKLVEIPKSKEGDWHVKLKGLNDNGWILFRENNFYLWNGKTNCKIMLEPQILWNLVKEDLELKEKRDVHFEAGGWMYNVKLLNNGSIVFQMSLKYSYEWNKMKMRSAIRPIFYYWNGTIKKIATDADKIVTNNRNWVAWQDYDDNFFLWDGEKIHDLTPRMKMAMPEYWKKLFTRLPFHLRDMNDNGWLFSGRSSPEEWWFWDGKKFREIREIRGAEIIFLKIAK